MNAYKSNLMLSLALGILILGQGCVVKAADLEDYVNSKIKEEFIKVEGEDLRASVEFPDPDKNLTAVQQRPRPMDHRDPALQHVTPTTLGEQPGTGELPRAGWTNKIDPTDPLEQKVIEKQAYDLYRENYRRAVQKEFLRRLHDAGWDTTRDIAAEIKRQEDAISLQPKPYVPY